MHIMGGPHLIRKGEGLYNVAHMFYPDGSHHGDVPYDRIHFSVIDTPEDGVKITRVRVEKGISEKESLIQYGIVD